MRAIAPRRTFAAALITAVSVVTVAEETAAASTVSLQRGVLAFRSAPGDVTRVWVDLEPFRAPRDAVVTATGSKVPTADSGCDYEDAPDPTVTSTVVVRCPLPADGSLPRVRVSLGERRAAQEASVDGRLRAVIYGGPGVDVISANGELYGRGGRDILKAEGLGKQDLWGGAGDDEIYAGRGRDVIHPGPGEDQVWLANQNRGETAWKDRARDTVSSRDGESDDIRCDAHSPPDRLLVDGLDWPSDSAQRLCAGVVRSSLALPLPFAVASPDYEVADGTWVWVFCPWDGMPTCAGTITVRVAGRTLGPKRFRIRAGDDHSYKLGDGEFGSDDNSVTTLVTLRMWDRGGRLHRVVKTVLIPPSPYS